MKAARTTPAVFSLRERKAAATRLALLDAMLRRLAEQPLDRVSVKDLCAELSISEPTFFNHFGSKNDLLVFFVGLWSVEMAAIMAAAGPGGRAALEALLARTAAQAATLPRLLPEIVAWQARGGQPSPASLPTPAEIALRHPSLAPAEAVPVRTLIASAVDRAVRSGELPGTTNRSLAAGMIAALFFGAPVLHAESLGKIYTEGLRATWRGLGGTL